MAAVLPSVLVALAPKLVELIGKLIQDPAAKAAATQKLFELQQAGELAQLNADMQTALAQIGVNAVEAQSANWFVAGPRPFIMWTCGIALAIQFVVGPLGTWVTGLFGHSVPFPQMDMATLMPIVLGILGLGTMRTVEKLQNAQGNH